MYFELVGGSSPLHGLIKRYKRAARPSEVCMPIVAQSHHYWWLKSARGVFPWHAPVRNGSADRRKLFDR
jgi:hypothetical protein